MKELLIVYAHHSATQLKAKHNEILVIFNTSFYSVQSLLSQKEDLADL